FPTASPEQSACFVGGTGCHDAFVTKLNAAGSALVYSTYLGGSSDDEGRAIAVDGSGNAYVTGYTLSTDFPTVSPEQSACFVVGNGCHDAFVTKLDATGSTLTYSTYLGGSNDDEGYAIAVDGSGNAYVTGYTLSLDFPTASPEQSACFGNITTCHDAFVTKLKDDGTALIYSTYLGGSNDDEGYGIAVDGSGNAYVTGYTLSLDFPTASPEQSACFGNITTCHDAFVTKLKDDGSALVYSTYLGGSSDDEGKGIAVDGSGNAYVTGYTLSTDFPTANPLRIACFVVSMGCHDVFVSMLKDDGSGLVYSTYLGGSSDDEGKAIAVDASGNVYVTGFTLSTDFLTINPLRIACFVVGMGCHDAFLAKIEPAGGGSESSGGNCFIATAAYGSYLDPHVQVLRNFRDRVLETNWAGRLFVRIYYRYSPPVAALIAKHEGLRIAARAALTPVVYAVEYPLGAGMILFVAVAGAGYSVGWRRKTCRGKLR
ncbi:MAG TPA: SBBP repeat-containing protein, partial [Nitrospiria bacterium]|nr:SBBP repeat-containing protein [Nitrospiria bacterium]